MKCLLPLLHHQWGGQRPIAEIDFQQIMQVPISETAICSVCVNLIITYDMGNKVLGSFCSVWIWEKKKNTQRDKGNSHTKLKLGEDTRLQLKFLGFCSCLFPFPLPHAAAEILFNPIGGHTFFFHEYVKF